MSLLDLLEKRDVECITKKIRYSAALLLSTRTIATCAFNSSDKPHASTSAYDQDGLKNLEVCVASYTQKQIIKPAVRCVVASHCDRWHNQTSGACMQIAVSNKRMFSSHMKKWKSFKLTKHMAMLAGCNLGTEDRKHDRCPEGAASTMHSYCNQHIPKFAESHVCSAFTARLAQQNDRHHAGYHDRILLHVMPATCCYAFPKTVSGST